ncbi:hypothetical protein BpHYR1_016947 [Brachionus plicatilis]|uniref:Uncharacterized protein n=1 Tax=Brachionus plicatilis TaxID=10195 RepID=A0A3M7SS45_BRAPC|nr:hypothetical protein BpHYR1_016947 [Brachionus plicatilis]
MYPGSLKYESRSVRSSDNSSSGNGSDVELLSSSKSKSKSKSSSIHRQIQQQQLNSYMKQQQTNYYEIQTMASMKTTKISSMQQELRTLDKIPPELKRSKPSLADADSEISICCCLLVWPFYIAANHGLGKLDFFTKN